MPILEPNALNIKRNPSYVFWVNQNNAILPISVEQTFFRCFCYQEHNEQLTNLPELSSVYFFIEVQVTLTSKL